MAVLVLGSLWLVRTEIIPRLHTEPLPKMWEVTDFTLTERSGQPLSFADLKGKVWVADLFYTTCPGPCPMLTSRLSDVQKAVGDLADVRLVSVSSDPEKDTPAILRQYAQKFGAKDHWFFLTGAKAEIYRFANEGLSLASPKSPARPNRSPTPRSSSSSTGRRWCAASTMASAETAAASSATSSDSEQMP